MEGFSEFNEKSDGVYVGAKFSDLSLLQLMKLQRQYGIANPLDVKDMHVTVLFSRNVIPVTPKDYQFKALPIKLTSFGNARVLILSCPELSARHEELMAQGGTHDYPEYNVHVTLSYDMPELPDEPVASTQLIIQNEYVEPLDLDWKSDK